jgi:probable ATP-dependent RNA helicase DDX4
MFSATFSQEIQRMAAKYLRRDYLFVTVGIVGGACKDVEQNFLSVDRDEKKKKLISLLEEQGMCSELLVRVLPRFSTRVYFDSR